MGVLGAAKLRAELGVTVEGGDDGSVPWPIRSFQHVSRVYISIGEADPVKLKLPIAQRPKLEVTV